MCASSEGASKTDSAHKDFENQGIRQALQLPLRYERPPYAAYRLHG